MSTKTSSAQHRATPQYSVAIEGLKSTIRKQSRNVGRPAAIAVAVTGIVLVMGSPAQAGIQSPAIPGNPAERNSNTSSLISNSSSIHTVAPGDTMSRIATAYGMRLDQLLINNGMLPTTTIYPGDRIQISNKTASSSAVKPTAVDAGPAVATGEANASSLGSSLLKSAYAQVGVSQDCTAMVERALRSVGKNVGDLAPTQFFQFGTTVSSPAPGDLVITSGHVGIYAGNGQVVSGGVNGYQTAVHPLSWLAAASFVRVT